ncbi:MAG TPA: N-acetylmuramoyl-L-alanine amidase [Vicinamibacterales bacterium]|jgi:N-acetylmuramoyl-L-alanine amidase
MRSFANARSRVMVATAVAWLSVCAIASAQTARDRFESALERDVKVRALLTDPTDSTPPADVVKQVGQVTTAFEAIVRRFPSSGYADNALWQAAGLADASYQRLSRTQDRDRALRLYQWLVKEYPSSSFVKQANARIAGIAKEPVPAAPLAAVPVAPAAAVAPMKVAVPVVPPASSAAISSPAAAPASRATLTGIQRQVLPDSVRITLELDHEVAYREERLAGPARLFFDLKNVQLVPDLKDKVLSYNSDVVNKIRVGRHPDSTVRVVLDLEEVSKYSVFTLYSPFRLVIDAERARPIVAAATTRNAAAAPPPPPVAAAPVPAPVIPPAVITRTAIPAEVILPPMPDTAAPIVPTPTSPDANVAGGFSMARQLGLSVSRIVIDPGHGGHDPGTIAKGLTEASLTLDVALRLEKLLQKELGVEVVLTRRTDVYVPLEERTAIANRENADLFLSIHANSSRTPTARGIETYFLSFASSPEAEAIAARENSASEREMHQLPDIIKAISLNNKLDESRDLANMVQESLVSTLRKSNREIRSRGVKKAPFVVLIGASMPSVLAEISFITNRQELQLVKTAAYKDKIAQALYTAVLRYRRSLKGSAVATIER